jgi:hypothetical protein
MLRPIALAVLLLSAPACVTLGSKMGHDPMIPMVVGAIADVTVPAVAMNLADDDIGWTLPMVLSALILLPMDVMFALLWDAHAD